MKLVSFLGTTDYQEVVYAHGDAECSTRFFPVAAHSFFQPDSVHLVVTEAAEQKHYAAIAAELGSGVPVTPIRIPEGRSETEIWQIFAALTEALQTGDEVILDITYGFRSLPMLSIIAAAFLRVAKGVAFKHLIYGAFDVKDERGRRPVFDLSSFLTLMEWTSATDQFLKTGNAGDLVTQLRAAHSLPYRTPRSGDKERLPRQLQTVGAAIGAVSTAMRLVRPHEVMTAAVGLDEQLTAVRPEVEEWAKPFSLLLDRTRTAYAAFALTEPMVEISISLNKQLALIHWYLERDQIVQAVTLAREWVVSLTCFRLKWHLIDDRHLAESMLNLGVHALRDGKPLPPPIKNVTDITALIKAWSRIQDLRNDVAHCGMRTTPRPTSKIIAGITELVEELDILAPALLETSPVH